MFAPQKGANAKQVLVLDRGLRRLGKFIGSKVANMPGAGAAGGLGAGLVAFCGAKLKPGAKTLFEWTDFDKKLRNCDWLLSGEGSLDQQSLGGKLPFEACMAARKAGKPCLLFVGCLKGGAKKWKKHGAIVVTLQKPKMSKKESIRKATQLLEQGLLSNLDVR